MSEPDRPASHRSPVPRQRPEPARAVSGDVARVWLAILDFASKHSASLATAASDPRDPSFADDWCALVNTAASAYANTPDHNPDLLPQGWPPATGAGDA